MAYSVVETHIANPARRRKKNVARKLSAKQIRYFGSPRQKAALKAKRRAKPKASNTASGPTLRNRAPWLHARSVGRPRVPRLRIVGEAAKRT